MAAVLRLEVPRLQAEQAAATADQSDGDRKASAPPRERDTRFDPEDDWAPEPAFSNPETAHTQPSGRRFEANEDFPETWLR
jgi:hypothetical protein